MVDTELTVSQPVRVSLRLAELDFNGLLRAVEQALAQAARQLVGLLVRGVERAALADQPQRFENRGQQTRHIQTTWGRVAVRRTRVRDRQTGRTYNLADAVLGWPRYLRRDARAVSTACELAVTLPYRPACHWFKRLTGQPCSVMNFWRMVQQGGEALARQERDGVGEIAADDPPPKAVRRLYLEADGVWLRRQRARRRGSSAEAAWPSSGMRGLLVYAGVSYSRLEATGPRRRNAVDKQVCVEVESLRGFERQWGWQVRRRFDLERCPNQLFLCDGEEGLLRLGRRQFRAALLQIDRFHVHQQLGRALGLHTPSYHTALRRLCRGQVGRVQSLLALHARGGRASAVREARTYLARHRTWLYTHREWERRTTVCKMGSGVIEKTIETQINRRMKRQGMSWSAAGARRLAKLRVLYRERAALAAFLGPERGPVKPARRTDWLATRKGAAAEDRATLASDPSAVVASTRRRAGRLANNGLSTPPPELPKR